MSHEKTVTSGRKPHVLPLKIYAGVWIGLLVLTLITVKVSYLDFGVFNLVIAMGIATLKATLVVLFFMHLKYDEPFNVVVFVSSLAFLAVFFMLTLADTMERGQVDPLEADVIVPVPARVEPAGGASDEADSTAHGEEIAPEGSGVSDTGEDASEDGGH
jgi:cytochrome c oxidase subunit 4